VERNERDHETGGQQGENIAGIGEMKIQVVTAPVTDATAN
jgi:hypothetical protein